MPVKQRDRQSNRRWRKTGWEFSDIRDHGDTLDRLLHALRLASHLAVDDQQTPAEDALTANTIAMVVLAMLLPIGGLLSDAWGHKRMLLLGCVGYAVLSVPLFHLLSQGEFADALAAQVAFAICTTLTFGSAPAIYVELFPTTTRYSGIAIGYNAALALFGGTTPFVSTWLISATGDTGAPSFYLSGIAVLTASVVLFVKDRSHQPLEEIE